MIARSEAVYAVLGSARLEDAEFSEDVVALMRGWANSDRLTSEIGKLAKRAAVGQLPRATAA